MPDEEEEYDVTGAIRVGLDIALTLASLYVLWVYMKDQPEVAATTERLAAWWTKVTTEGRRVKKMENETVFEAIQVVDSVSGD